LKLNLYIGSGSGLNSADVLKQMEQVTGLSVLKTDLQEMNAFYEQIGIKPIVNRIENLPEEYNQAKLVGTDPNPEFQKLYSLFKTEPGELNIFFLRPNNEVLYSG